LEVQLDSSIAVLAILQGKSLVFPPLRNMTLQINNAIALMGNSTQIIAFCETQGLKLVSKLTVFSEALHPVRAGLCEAVVPPGSQLIGRELRDLHMRRTHKVHVLAVYRDKTVYRGDDLRDLSIHSGDTLGMFSQWEALNELHKNPDFVVLTSSYPREELRPQKMRYALLFFILSIGLMISNQFSISVSVLLGAFGMIGTGVLSIDEAYAAVSWQTVFLLAGLIPLGIAMQTTGTTDWLVQHVMILHQYVPVWILPMGLALLSTGLAFVISNVGATIVLVPIALDLAWRVGASPRIYALVVAVAASNTFVLPMQQANALIAGPGGYRTRDFMRVGSVMTVLYWVLMLTGISLFF
jgi:di/tricarboxylate transporter